MTGYLGMDLPRFLRLVRARKWLIAAIVVGAAALAFVASANKISTSLIWTQLNTGQLIAEKGPLAVLSDPFSYTEPGARWTMPAAGSPGAAGR